MGCVLVEVVGTEEEGAPAVDAAALTKGVEEGAGTVASGWTLLAGEGAGASVLLVGGDDGTANLAGEVEAAVGIERAIDSPAALISGCAGFATGGALISDDASGWALISDDVDFDLNSTKDRRIRQVTPLIIH